VRERERERENGNLEEGRGDRSIIPPDLSGTDQDGKIIWVKPVEQGNICTPVGRPDAHTAKVSEDTH
jgi:hypothetical protein